MYRSPAEPVRWNSPFSGSRGVRVVTFCGFHVILVVLPATATSALVLPGVLFTRIPGGGNGGVVRKDRAVDSVDEALKLSYIRGKRLERLLGKFDFLDLNRRLLCVDIGRQGSGRTVVLHLSRFLFLVCFGNFLDN